MQDLSADNSLNDIRDLIEPVRRPRFRESVIEPWLDHRRSIACDDDDGDRQRTLDESRYSEFQIVGSDNDDSDGDDLGNDDSALCLARIASLLSTPTSTSTTTTTTSSTNPPSDGQEDARKRFLEFLFHDAPTTRILWLSRTRFLTCDGPKSDDTADDDDDDDGASRRRAVLIFWIYYGVDHPWAYEATVAPAATEGDDDGTNNYTFRLSGVSENPYPSPISGSSSNVSIEDDPWPPVLAELLSQAPHALEYGCSLDLGRHLDCLEGIVSRRPPPREGGSGWTLNFVHSTNVTEEAARIIAHRTHRDTAIVVDLEGWGESSVAVLMEAMRENKCPKRLVLRGAGEWDVAEPMARALTDTTAVEELEVSFPSRRRPDGRRRCDLLLDAIRDNVGLRRLTIAQRGDPATSAFLKDFWSAALASRTLWSADVSQLTSSSEFTAEQRQECARHVVSLLQSNRVMTELGYDRDSLDANIVESHALPLLQLNRLRKAAPCLGRILPAVLFSNPVRRHPMLRYFVLRTNVGHAARLLASAADAPRVDDGSFRPRTRPRRS